MIRIRLSMQLLGFITFMLFSCSTNSHNSLDTFRVLNLELNRNQTAQLLRIKDISQQQGCDSLILKKTQQLYDYIQECKGLIGSSDYANIKFNNIYSDIESFNLYYYKVDTPFDYEVIDDIMIGDANDMKARELKYMLEFYKKDLLSKDNSSIILQSIETILPLTIKDTEKGFSNDWSIDFFHGQSKIGGLLILTQLQNDILNCCILYQDSKVNP